jgi:hypothetical protein
VTVFLICYAFSLNSNLKLYRWPCATVSTHLETVGGDPIVVFFSRFERRRFLRPYSSAEIYLNRFLPVYFVAAVVGARTAPAAMRV